MAAASGNPDDVRKVEFCALANAIGAPLLLVDTRGTVQAVSEAAQRLLGAARARLEGHALANVLGLDAHLVLRTIRNASRSRGHKPGAFVLRDGTRLRFRIGLYLPRADAESWLAIALESGSDHFSALNRKIAELTTEVKRRQRVERELQRVLEREKALRQEAERATHLKDEFLAMISHELRSPLNAILGWAALLHMQHAKCGDAELVRGISIIERNARAQARLISDLLDYSRMSSGRMRLELEATPLVDVARSASEAIRHTAEIKSIEIRCHFDAVVGSVLGEPVRLQQVLWNLLTNAVRYTPAGGRIELRIRDLEHDVEVSVSDTGIGIDGASLRSIFEPFRQGPRATREQGGVGLGLAVARKIVELHGGTLSAASEGEGKGATFTLVLPKAPLPRARAAVVTAPAVERPEQTAVGSDARLDGVRVLVVEDQLDSLQPLVRWLEGRGARATGVTSAAQALAQIESEAPDLLISDIEMPGGDGYTMMRRIRELADNAAQRLPAIALTAYARSQDRVRALAAGFDMHVSKPIDHAELLTVIASLLARRAV